MQQHLSKNNFNHQCVAQRQVYKLGPFGTPNHSELNYRIKQVHTIYSRTMQYLNIWLKQSIIYLISQSKLDLLTMYTINITIVTFHFCTIVFLLNRNQRYTREWYPLD